MAAVTVAESDRNVVGKNREVNAVLTAPANGDTLDARTLGFFGTVFGIQVTFATASAAADSISVTRSADKLTLTFNVVGTARDLFVQLVGL